MSKRGSNSELFAHENDTLTARPQLHYQKQMHLSQIMLGQVQLALETNRSIAGVLNIIKSITKNVSISS